MSDTPTIRAFVNEQPVEVPRGAPARAAVAALDPALAERLDRAGAYLTDGRGIRVGLEEALAPGAILRVVLSARRGADADA